MVSYAGMRGMLGIPGNVIEISISNTSALSLVRKNVGFSHGGLSLSLCLVREFG